MAQRGVLVEEISVLQPRDTSASREERRRRKEAGTPAAKVVGVSPRSPGASRGCPGKRKGREPKGTSPALQQVTRAKKNRGVASQATHPPAG